MSLPRNLAAALRRVPLDTLRVLEPACGGGKYLRHFGAGSVGLDRNMRLPQDFRGAPQSIHTVELDEPGWTAGLAGFQAAYLCDVLMHVRDPLGFLRDLQPTLEPGAPVLLVEWFLPGGALTNWLARRVPGARDVFETPQHIQTFTRQEIEALVNRAGFRIQDQWLHTFDARLAWIVQLVRSFWPTRTWHLVAESPAHRKFHVSESKAGT